MKNYDPINEYKVNIKSKNAQKEIVEARQLYEAFATEFVHLLDLEKPSAINLVFEKANQSGIFKRANYIRNLIFGKDIHFYGVVYLWDACQNYCSYCPGSIPNRKKLIEQGINYPLRELTIKQAVLETQSVMKAGHTHICFLCGSAPGITKLPDKIIPFLKAIDKLGLNEIILNIEPLRDEGFKAIRDSVKNTPLQYRVFQETYNKKSYLELHPKGEKSNYVFRIESQERAMNAGFNNFGLGVLFGLHRYPIEEINDLITHSENMKKSINLAPARICLPSANELKNIGVDIPYFIKRGSYNKRRSELLEADHYEKLTELIYALTKLAMPTTSIVSSERDCPAMLKILDKYATCTTLNVQSGVGENTKIFKKNEDESVVHFEQTTDYPREPNSTKLDMLQRGYNPILKDMIE